MQSMNVHWVKCGSDGERWCSLKRVQLDNVYSQGVYMIWHSGPAPNVVYIGQGNIAERIRFHRQDPEILNYETYGNLLVTWAEVYGNQMDGVERFLANTYSPKVGHRYPDVFPITVNLPA